MTGSRAAPKQATCRRWLCQQGHVGDDTMRSAENGGRRQEASRGYSVTQVFYADGEKTSTGMVQAVLYHLGARVTHFENTSDCLDSLKAGDCEPS